MLRILTGIRRPGWRDGGREMLSEIVILTPSAIEVEGSLLNSISNTSKYG